MSAEEVSARNSEWETALLARDAEAAGRVLAEDYALVLVQPEKAEMLREAWLALLPDYVIDNWTVEERVVHVSGDVATVLQRVAMKATVSGADRSGTFVISDTWVRADGEWRVWRRHSTPLQAGAL